MYIFSPDLEKQMRRGMRQGIPWRACAWMMVCLTGIACVTSWQLRTREIFAASYRDHPYRLRWAARLGADIETRLAQGETPLLVACSRSSVGAALALIAIGADVNVQDTYGATALHWAAAHHDHRLILSLINAGADVNARTRDGSSPLMLTLVKPDLKAVELLLDAGANPNITAGPYNHSPLHIAAHSGTPEIVEALIEAGANLFALCSNGNSPLNMARHAGNRDIRDIIQRAMDTRRRRVMRGRTPIDHALAQTLVRHSGQSL